MLALVIVRSCEFGMVLCVLEFCGLGMGFWHVSLCWHCAVCLIGLLVGVDS